MTDYFALLDQPRRPWLQPERLKQAFHAKALHAHPDAHAQHGDAESSDGLFAQLNEAHRVLQDPKLRLHHLLTLTGHPPDRAASAAPSNIDELFPLVAAATHQASAVVQKSAVATNALSRSLLKAELQKATQQVNGAHDRVSELQERALSELQQLDRVWSDADEGQVAQLSQLHLQLSYLTRWVAELHEKRVQLAIA
ncbi:MAG: J domain-containing protein [Chthoniobacterales bacterium]